MNSAATLSVRRHGDGAPILKPTDRWWEAGVTLNAAATFLPPNTEANTRLIKKLLAGTVYYNSQVREGLVAIHYRARPMPDPTQMLTRSFVGLALFTPKLELIYRYPEPVLSPDEDDQSPDVLGAEDPRITRIGDKFYMVYCGSGYDESRGWRGSLCWAESDDLLHWTKRGRYDLRYPPQAIAKGFDNSYFDNMHGLSGTSQHVNNKDGVLFPGANDGWYYMLHRPMIAKINDWAIHLARSRTLDGIWVDLGPICTAAPHSEYPEAWLGAGAVPIDMGDGRYLELYHSGHRAADGSRLYTLGAIMFDFNQLDPARPASMVESRLDHFMVPETPWEIEGPFPDSVGNVLFSCGAYERGDDIVIIYGGGDTYVMAATVNKSDLLAAMSPVAVG